MKNVPRLLNFKIEFWHSCSYTFINGSFQNRLVFPFHGFNQFIQKGINILFSWGPEKTLVVQQTKWRKKNYEIIYIYILMIIYTYNENIARSVCELWLIYTYIYIYRCLLRSHHFLDMCVLWMLWMYTYSHILTVFVWMYVICACVCQRACEWIDTSVSACL